MVAKTLILAACALSVLETAAAQTSLSEQVRLTEVGKQAVAAWRKSNPDMAAAGAWELKYGAEYLELGNFEDADVHFRRSLASNPRNASAHYLRGLALLGLGRRAEASEEFEQTRAIDPALAQRGMQQMGPAPGAGRVAPAPPAAGSLAWSGRVFSAGQEKATTGTLRIALGAGNTVTASFHSDPPLAGDWVLSGTKISTLCEFRGATQDGRPVEIRGSCTEARFEGSFDIRGERGDNGTLALEKGGRKEPAPITGSAAEQQCIREFAVCNARANAGRGFNNNSLAGVNDCTFQKTQCMARAQRKR